MPDESHPQSVIDRLDRIEESLAFTERAVEQLSSEIADINRRVQVMTRRLAAIEDRLNKPTGESTSDAENGGSDPSGGSEAFAS